MLVTWLDSVRGSTTHDAPACNPLAEIEPSCYRKIGRRYEMCDSMGGKGRPWLPRISYLSRHRGSLRQECISYHTHTFTVPLIRPQTSSTWQPRKIQSWSSMRSASSGRMCTASANGYSQPERDIQELEGGSLSMATKNRSLNEQYYNQCVS